MDDEAKQRLIVQAKVQHARDEARRGRSNMPIGVALLLLGVGISIGALMLPIGLLGMIFVGGIGFMFIPGGLAVIIKSSVAIAREGRVLRELEPPTARVVE